MLCIDHYNVLKFTFISVSTHRRCLCKLTCTVARVAGSTVTLSGSGTAQNVGENISGKPEVQPDLLQMLALLHLLLNHQPGNVFLTIFLLNILKCLKSLSVVKTSRISFIFELNRILTLFFLSTVWQVISETPMHHRQPSDLLSEVSLHRRLRSANLRTRKNVKRWTKIWSRFSRVEVSEEEEDRRKVVLKSFNVSRAAHSQPQTKKFALTIRPKSDRKSVV